MSTEAFIYDAIRTPRGRGKNGALHGAKPILLLVGQIDALRQRNPNLDVDRIDDVVLGVVSPVGDQGVVIARTAVLAAGLPNTVGGVQLNRFCASGLEAINTAAQKVRSGWDHLIIAGGVESMSRVPIGSDGGAWAMDPATNFDSYFVPQGIGADLIATIEGFSRDDVDGYAVQSQQRAENAWQQGYFSNSVIPVLDQNGLMILDHDEHRPPQLYSAIPRFAESSVCHHGRDGWLRCGRAAEISPGRKDRPCTHRREFLWNRGRCCTCFGRFRASRRRFRLDAASTNCRYRNKWR